MENYLVILLAAQPGDTRFRYLCYKTDTQKNIILPGICTGGKTKDILLLNSIPDPLPKNHGYYGDLDLIIREYFPENDSEEIKKILLKIPENNLVVNNEKLMEGDSC